MKKAVRSPSGISLSCEDVSAKFASTVQNVQVRNDIDERQKDIDRL